jgi:hypothetical protein
MFRTVSATAFEPCRSAGKLALFSGPTELLPGVTALAPEVGQSTLDQYAEVAPPPDFQPDAQPDGFAFLSEATFKAGFAGDVSDADAAFLRDSQIPVAMRALEARVTRAAWRTKPSWYVVAKEDGAIAPALLRSTAAGSVRWRPKSRAAMSCS